MSRNTIIFTLLIPLVVILFVFDLLSGDTTLSAGQVWNVFTGNETDETTRNIVLSIRLVRVIVAILIGVALSISGLQMQTVFRNPLADPYLLGVSSGSGLGVAFFILGAPLLGLAHSGFWQSVGIVGAGWGGAVMVLLLIAIISRYVKNILGVLIMGVMIGYIAGAIIQILQYLSSAEQLKMFFLWSMGSLGHVTTTKLLIMIHTRNLLYQSIESFVVGRKLCSNHGIKYSTSPDTHFHIDDITHRNCNRLLRSGRFSWACHSSRGSNVVQ